MFIFNTETQHFIKIVRETFLDILKEETDLELKGNKIIYRGYLYPINFVVFEDKKTLGFYNQSTFQVGLNKELLRIDDEHTLKNVIRHEMAHLYLHLTKKESYRAHGKEFKEVFDKFNWNKDFSKASIPITSQDTPVNKVSNKIKKLLDLSHSPNEFEAQLAAKKAKELIEKHNITRELHHESDSTYACQVLSFKRKNSLYDGIYQILTHYYVYPVYNQGRGESYLEVIGERVNVEIADYVASYLHTNVPKLWETVKKENKLKGVTAKNSFYISFFKELSKKLESEKIQTKEHREDGNTSKDLTLNLEAHVKRVYPRLSKVSSGQKKRCPKSEQLGKKSAKNFSIRGALSKNKKSKKGILTWQ